MDVEGMTFTTISKILARKLEHKQTNVCLNVTRSN